jgi:hypothetical protein
MFDKKAEEIANKRCHEIMCYGHCSFNSPKHHRCGEWHREYNCAKEGIEYGYSQANEWHKASDKLPEMDVFVYIWNDTDECPFVARRHIPIGRKDWIWDCNIGRGLYRSQSVGKDYLWKEIIPPKKEINHEK